MLPRFFYNFLLTKNVLYYIISGNLKTRSYQEWWREQAQ